MLGSASLPKALARQKSWRKGSDGWLSQKDVAMWLSALDTLAFSLSQEDLEEALLTVFLYGFWVWGPNCQELLVLLTSSLGKSLTGPSLWRLKRQRINEVPDGAMHLVSSALLLGLADLVAGAHVEVKRSSFLKPVEFQHQLRLCNAYPGTEVFRVELAGQNLTKSSFTVDSLPGYDAILYIVVQRQDARTDSVTFQSHLFAMARNAQVAVMDTYVGQAKAALLMSNSTGRTRGGVGRTQVVQARALIHEEVYGLHYIM
eukprot:g22263.t1